ncbi:MAG: type II secretion system minor pseudopilin GspH [Porticoccaceae bacterium]|nr:type II secretion system minor pseudopilin GspH [Porticoccaceae bacterium]
MNQAQSWQSTSRGFTLLEIMIVIVIIGLTTGLVVVSLGVLDQRRTVAEANRLKLALNQAADAALMQQETLGWFYQDDLKQYSLKMLNQDAEWVQLTQVLFAPYTINNLCEITVTSEAISEAMPEVIEDLSNIEDDDSEQPAIIFLSSGEYSPFELNITNQKELLIQLSGDGFGSVEVKAAES